MFGDRWQRRFVGGLFLVWLVAIPLWWIVGNYLGLSVSSIISFKPDDGWCDPQTQGLGTHCFGDYYYPALRAGSPESWSENAPTHAYTPSGMIPHVLGNFINGSGLSRIGVAAYLVVLGISGLSAALAAGLAQKRYPVPMVLFCLGVGTYPFLMALDRGNSVVLVVPALLWFARALFRDQWWAVAGSIFVATLIRPQFLILVLVLLAVRKWKQGIVVAVSSLGFLLLSFALWPGDWSANLLSWWRSVTRYTEAIPIDDSTTTNLSAAHAMALLADALAMLPGTLKSVGDALTEILLQNPSLPGLFLLLCVVIGLTLFGRDLPKPALLLVVLPLPALIPSVSFGYYSVFALVLGAALLTTPAHWFCRYSGAPLTASETDTESPSTITRAFVVFACVWTLVPLPISLAQGVNSAQSQSLGLVWLIVVFLSLGQYLSRSKSKDSVNRTNEVTASQTPQSTLPPRIQKHD